MRGQHIKLARNPDYWNGPAYVDFLVFKVVPEEATRVLALESGEADVLFETPPSAIATLKKNPKLRVNRVPTYRDVNVHWNAMKAPTDDARLRRALSQAIDVKSIVEEVITADIGQVATGIFNPSVFGACDVGFPVYNLARAKQGFAELGYRPGKDGILEKDGQPLDADAGGEPPARPPERRGGRGDPGPAPGGRRRHEGERQRVRHLHEDPPEPRGRLQHDLPRVRRGDR